MREAILGFGVLSLLRRLRLPLAAVVLLLTAGAAAQRGVVLSDYAADDFAGAARAVSAPVLVRRMAGEDYVFRGLRFAEQVLTRQRDALAARWRGVAADALLAGTSADFARELRGGVKGFRAREAQSLIDYWTGVGEDSLGALAVVRTVNIDYVSELGGRPWSFGAGAMGALRETGDDVVAWALRGYSGGAQVAGGNAGLIYRRAVDIADIAAIDGLGGLALLGDAALLGGNVFLDYADSDWGGFWRWSFGAEWRSSLLDFYANRYAVITDGKAQANGKTAYSRDGYDFGAQARVNRYVSGGLTYYRFAGGYGDADERGVRYHLRLHPAALAGGDFFGNLRLRLEYDQGDRRGGGGGNRFGGQIEYAWKLNAATAAGGGGVAGGDADYDPRDDFFAPVVREYQQRINLNEGAAAIIVSVVSAEVTVNGVLVSAVTVGGGSDAVSVTAVARDVTMSVATDATGTARISAGSWRVSLFADSTLTYDAVGSGDVVSLHAGSLYYESTGASPVSEMILGDGVITLALHGTAFYVYFAPGNPANFDLVVYDGNIGLTINQMLVTLTQLPRVGDGSNGNAPMLDLNLIASVGAPVTQLALSPMTLRAGERSFSIATGFTGAAHTITALGGIGGVDATYAVLSVAPSVGYSIGNDNGVLSVTTATNVRTDHTIFVRAEKTAAGFTVTATLEIAAMQEPPVSFADDVATVTVGVNAAFNRIWTAQASGGVPPYTYALISTHPPEIGVDKYNIDTNTGVLDLTSPHSAVGQHTVLVEVTATHTRATLGLSVNVVSSVSVERFQGVLTVPVDEAYLNFYRIMPMGGSGDYTYSILQTGTDWQRYSVDADGHLSIITPFGLNHLGVQTVSIVVADEFTAATVGEVMYVVRGAGAIYSAEEPFAATTVSVGAAPGEVIYNLFVIGFIQLSNVAVNIVNNERGYIVTRVLTFPNDRVPLAGYVLQLSAMVTANTPTHTVSIVVADERATSTVQVTVFVTEEIAATPTFVSATDSVYTPDTADPFISQGEARLFAAGVLGGVVDGEVVGGSAVADTAVVGELSCLQYQWRGGGDVEFFEVVRDDAVIGCLRRFVKIYPQAEPVG